LNKPALSALVLAASLLLVGAAGVAVGDSHEFANETVSVDNQTDTVYLEVENVTNGPVNVSVYGLDSGNETLVNETQIDAPPDNSTLIEWTANHTEYDGYRVVVKEDSTVDQTQNPQSVERVDVGTFDKVSGGGGALGSTGGSAAIVVVLIVGVYLVMKEEE